MSKSGVTTPAQLILDSSYGHMEGSAEVESSELFV